MSISVSEMVQHTSDLNRYQQVTDDSSVLWLEKAQAGKVSVADIKDALDEFSKLFKVGLASKAEILTLTRAFPNSSTYAEAAKKQSEENEDDPIVIGGPASVSLVDREGHLITTGALDRAFKKFMGNIRTRNTMVLHSDVQIGWALPAYISKGGQIFKSGVDDKGLFFICELRDDTAIAKKVAEQINKGMLKSYSIAGSATKVQNINKGLVPYLQVDDMELAEVTVCIGGKTLISTEIGLEFVKHIEVGDNVVTHKNRLRKVLRIMNREVDEFVYKVTTSDGKTIDIITSEHPVRKFDGTRYTWVAIKNIKVGDKVQIHKRISCEYCQMPLFRKTQRGREHQRRFCNRKCFNAVSRTFKGITKEQNPKLTGGIRTEEGKVIHKAAVTSDTFRAMRSNSMKQKMVEDPAYAQEIILRGRGLGGRIKLTKPEQFVRGLLGDDWKENSYFDGKFPDFLNLDLKKAIEVYGDYWHQGDNPQDRIDFFKEKGLESLVIWESEIKSQPEEVKERVAEFVGNSLTTITSIETRPFKGTVYNLEVEEDNSYVTEAFTVHNCEKGVNQGAGFELLKSELPQINRIEVPKPQVIERIVIMHSKDDGTIDFAQSFSSWMQKEHEKGHKDPLKTKESFATLNNEEGRRAEHQQLLREYGFPSEQPMESMRYVPVVETETDDDGIPVHNLPPWVVNEAGEALGDRLDEDSPGYKKSAKAKARQKAGSAQKMFYDFMDISKQPPYGEDRPRPIGPARQSEINELEESRKRQRIRRGEPEPRDPSEFQRQVPTKETNGFDPGVGRPREPSEFTRGKPEEPKPRVIDRMKQMFGGAAGRAKQSPGDLEEAGKGIGREAMGALRRGAGAAKRAGAGFRSGARGGTPYQPSEEGQVGRAGRAGQRMGQLFRTGRQKTAGGIGTGIGAATRFGVGTGAGLAGTKGARTGDTEAIGGKGRIGQAGYRLGRTGREFARGAMRGGTPSERLRGRRDASQFGGGAREEGRESTAERMGRYFGTAGRSGGREGVTAGKKTAQFIGEHAPKVGAGARRGRAERAVSQQEIDALHNQHGIGAGKVVSHQKWRGVEHADQRDVVRASISQPGAKPLHEHLANMEHLMGRHPTDGTHLMNITVNSLPKGHHGNTMMDNQGFMDLMHNGHVTAHPTPAGQALHTDAHVEQVKAGYANANILPDVVKRPEGEEKPNIPNAFGGGAEAAHPISTPSPQIVKPTPTTSPSMWGAPPKTGYDKIGVKPMAMSLDKMFQKAFRLRTSTYPKVWRYNHVNR